VQFWFKDVGDKTNKFIGLVFVFEEKKKSDGRQLLAKLVINIVFKKKNISKLREDVDH
jgi:hypothetical protein